MVREGSLVAVEDDHPACQEGHVAVRTWMVVPIPFEP
jgi:hypothetical protein